MEHCTKYKLTELKDCHFLEQSKKHEVVDLNNVTTLGKMHLSSHVQLIKHHKVIFPLKTPGKTKKNKSRKKTFLDNSNTLRETKKEHNIVATAPAAFESMLRWGLVIGNSLMASFILSILLFS